MAWIRCVDTFVRIGKDEKACLQISKARVAFPAPLQALLYFCKCHGLRQEGGYLGYDLGVCDWNDDSVPEQQAVVETMKTAAVLISTAALVCLDMEVIESIAGAFASKPAEGYMLVNFWNPFSLEKADDNKRVLLKHFNFVGSMATRHRKMSQLEQENYPGEEWAQLELWVLKRRVF